MPSGRPVVPPGRGIPGTPGTAGRATGRGMSGSGGDMNGLLPPGRAAGRGAGRGAAGASGSTGVTGSSVTGGAAASMGAGASSTGASTASTTGAAFAAFLAGAFLAGAGASAPSGAGGKISRSLRATGGSIVDDGDLTNSPISLSLARTSLLSTPNSLASSCTRALPTTALLVRSARTRGHCGVLAHGRTHRRVLIARSSLDSISWVKLCLLLLGRQPPTNRGEVQGFGHSKRPAESPSPLCLIQAGGVGMHPGTTSG